MRPAGSQAALPASRVYAHTIYDPVTRDREVVYGRALWLVAGLVEAGVELTVAYRIVVLVDDMMHEAEVVRLRKLKELVGR